MFASEERQDLECKFVKFPHCGDGLGAEVVHSALDCFKQSVGQARTRLQGNKAAQTDWRYTVSMKPTSALTPKLEMMVTVNASFPFWDPTVDRHWVVSYPHVLRVFAACPSSNV